jgi:hypothetical protein
MQIWLREIGCVGHVAQALVPTAAYFWGRTVSCALVVNRRWSACLQAIRAGYQHAAGRQPDPQSGKQQTVLAILRVAAGASKGGRRINNPPQVNNLPHEFLNARFQKLGRVSEKAFSDRQSAAPAWLNTPPAPA